MIGRAAKHLVLFATATILTMIAILLPAALFSPGVLAGQSPFQVVKEAGPASVWDLLRPYPIYLINAVAQIFVFRFVSKMPSLVYLAGVAAIWSAFYWWWWSSAI